MIKRSVSIISLLLIFLFSCKPKNKKDSTLCSSDYNQTELLTNYAENLIIPGLETFEKSMVSLQMVWQGYASGGVSLKELKDSFTETYLELQKIQCFDFGPMESQMFMEKANSFPLNQGALAKSISTVNINFSEPERFDIGFPALELLFFGLSNSDIDSFNTDQTRQYIDAILKDLVQRIKMVNADWVSYKTSFINAQGTDAGSSLSLIVNALNKSFEVSKRDRIGIPSGVLTLGLKQPELVEAPHSFISNKLLLANLEYSKLFFQGKHGGINGEGLDDVLAYINAPKNERGLRNSIEDNYDAIFSKIQLFPGSLKEQVQSANSSLVELYALMSKQVVYLKSDMPSVLCIAITYLDNPSDSD